VEKLVNDTFSGGHPTRGLAANKASEFETEIIPDFISLRVHPVGPQHFNVTLNVPLPVYVCTGFIEVDTDPSPNVHLQES
jgi:hypothetical protein